MNDDADYERARNAYRASLEEYAAALGRHDSSAFDRLHDAQEAWQRLCAFGRDEAQSPDMHVVLAFSYAVQAGAASDAERLYNEMSDEYRRSTDAAESRAPGSMKIWLSR